MAKSKGSSGVSQKVSFGKRIRGKAKKKLWPKITKT